MGCLKTAFTFGAAIGLACHGRAQPAASFDVAAIKENHSGERVMLYQPSPGGRFTATNCSLALLIEYGFQVMRFQIVGAPDWVMSARFDVDARKEGEPPLSEFPKLVQRLIEDRFQLREHWETREAPMYFLTATKAAKLRPAQTYEHCPNDAPCGALMNSPGRAKGYSLTAGDLAGSLSFFLQQTVIDNTGLTGEYDIELRWTPDSSLEADLPSISTAIEEQLGLKLRSGRGEVRFLVVDGVKKPSSN